MQDRTFILLVVTCFSLLVSIFVTLGYNNEKVINQAKKEALTMSCKQLNDKWFQEEFNSTNGAVLDAPYYKDLFQAKGCK